MLNLFQFFLLLFWRYHNKMLYWVPCFLCLGARTKKHRSLTPKKNRKKNWRKFFNRGFFRRSSQPQAWKSAQNNARKQPEKNRPKKIWDCLRRQVTTCLRRQPHPPPKKKTPIFFQKNAMLNPSFQVFCFFIDLIIITCSIENRSLNMGLKHRSDGH